MQVKELISRLPELGTALNRIFKDGAIFNSRYPMISYGGDSQDEQGQQPAGSEKNALAEKTIER